MTPIDVGARAPAFTATEVDGRAFRFAPATANKPTLLIFYRGGWCAYCNAHLQDLRTVVNAAEAFGVAYHVDDETLKQLKSYGIDLEASQGTTKHELPVPSVFVVDRSGVVRFRHFDPDITVRLDAKSVLAAARDSLAKP